MTDKLERVQAVQLKTTSMTRVLIRNGAGHKLFEMDVPGLCIAVVAALDAAITVEPQCVALTGDGLVLR